MKTTAPSHPLRRILLVDDDVDLAGVVRLILHETGQYEVRVVNHPELALRAAQLFRPDLLLLDVMMPGKDGGEVAAEIRADPELRNTPIVFLTAAVTGEEAVRGPIGGEVYLEKPVSRARLLECVARQLGA